MFTQHYGKYVPFYYHPMAKDTNLALSAAITKPLGNTRSTTEEGVPLNDDDSKIDTTPMSEDTSSDMQSAVSGAKNPDTIASIVRMQGKTKNSPLDSYL